VDCVPKSKLGVEVLNQIIKLGLVSVMPIIMTSNQKTILQRQLAGKNSLKFHSSLCKDDKYYANIGAAGIPKEQILNGETSMAKNPTRDGLLVTEDKLNKVSETMEEKVSSKSFSQKFSHLVYKSLEIDFSQ